MISLFKNSPRPLIVAHRGASGLLPEQTLAAFDRAFQQGADAIELDIVPTRDAVLIARHESELSLTTNIADNPDLKAFRSRQMIDGIERDGWFSTNLKLEQIHRVGATQRMDFRDHSHDGRWSVPTLDQVLDLTASHGAGVFIEVKHPAHFASLGFAIDELLLATLQNHDPDRVVIQSFDSNFLKRLRPKTPIPLIQLIENTAFDLHDISLYAQGIGPWKRLIVPAACDVDGAHHALHPGVSAPTTLIADAHRLGLPVATWTFRDEPQFLAPDYGGDPLLEYQHFIELGVDSLTTDFPATATQARSISRP